MVDELTLNIKEKFEFTQQEIDNDIDKKVSTITTSSPEAYKFYSEGRKLHLTGNYPQSIEKMLEVLDIDPDFAMAHRSLSSSYSNFGFRAARVNAIKKAFELSFKASDRERFIIAGDYYAKSYYWLGKIFQKKGERSRAVVNYETFLDLWKDADSGIFELEDVRSQLASLNSY